MPIKIRCPSGEEKTIEECRKCKKCFPLPIKNLLLKDRDRPPRPRKKPAFGVSRLTNCLRRAYYELTEEVSIPLEKLWVFSRGQAIHQLFQTEFPPNTTELFRQKEFGSFIVLGYIDALHEGTLYEFKTTNSIPEIPLEEHMRQAQAYFSLLSKEEQEKVKKILLVYFSLNKIVSFEIPKQDLTPWLEARGTILAEALKKGIPPPKEESSHCSYCEFKEFCMGKKETSYSPENNLVINDSQNERKTNSNKLSLFEFM